MPYDLMAMRRVQSLQYHCVRSDYSRGDGRPLEMSLWLMLAWIAQN